MASFNLHLQNEVAAALEVQSKLDAIGEILFYLAERSGDGGMPIRPMRQASMTMRIKMNFHLSCDDLETV